jgi:hypothetical protein
MKPSVVGAVELWIKSAVDGVFYGLIEPSAWYSPMQRGP